MMSFKKNADEWEFLWKWKLKDVRLREVTSNFSI